MNDIPKLKLTFRKILEDTKATQKILPTPISDRCHDAGIYAGITSKQDLLNNTLSIRHDI